MWLATDRERDVQIYHSRPSRSVILQSYNYTMPLIPTFLCSRLDPLVMIFARVHEEGKCVRFLSIAITYNELSHSAIEISRSH